MTDENAAADVAAHAQSRDLKETIYYPDHDPRTESDEYKAVHHHLVYELDEPCWVCGIKQSQLPEGEEMETHHWWVEWALVNSVDPAKILAQFPAMGTADDDHLRAWLDSELNMLVLCAKHHRAGLYGVHMITYPAWVVQKNQLPGWDLTTGPNAPTEPVKDWYDPTEG